MHEVIYAPAIIKMAETKKQFVQGPQLRELNRLIDSAIATDARAQRWSPIPAAVDPSRAAWEAEHDVSDAASRALRDFAAPL
jgi:hypothetical protein